MLADYIREYVKGECSNTPMGRELYDNHLILVAHYGLKLAIETGADTEIVELAAYLHDFPVVMDKSQFGQHEAKGVEIADKLLKQFNYPADKLERVKRCILNHTSLAKAREASPEEACLANAEVMSQIEKPDYWIKQYSTSNQDQDNRNRFFEYIVNSWPLLMDSARTIMEDKYAQIREMSHSYG